MTRGATKGNFPAFAFGSGDRLGEVVVYKIAWWAERLEGAEGWVLACPSEFGPGWSDANVELL